MDKQRDYKHLEDMGWNNMKSSLDINLPEKKNRRVLLLLLFCGISTIGFVGVSIWPGFKSAQSAKLPFKENPSNTTNQQNAKSKDDHSIECNAVALMNAGQTSMTKTNSKNSVKFTPFKSSIVSHSRNAATLFHENNKNFQASRNSSREQQESDSTTVVEPAWNDFNYPFLAILQPSKIHTGISNEPLLNTYIQVNIPKKTHRTPNRFGFGIHAGLQYYTATNTASYNAGMQIDFRMNNKWSLSLLPSLDMRTGNFLLLDEAESYFIANNIDSLQSQTGLFTQDEKIQLDASGFGSIQNTTVRKFQNLYNFQIPLYLNYKVHSKWMASLGLKAIIPLNKDIIASRKSIFMQWNGIKTFSWKVHPINYFFQVGIRYYPIHSFGISLDYAATWKFQQDGLDAIANPQGTSPKFKDSNHLSLSLNYRF